MDRIIQVPVEKFNSQIHKWQLEILRKFDAGEFRFALLRWHRRARKTSLLLNLLIRECIKNKNSVYGFIAPTYTQAKSIIWLDPNMLDSYLPKELVKRKNDSDLFVEFTNGSILAVHGGDNPDSIRGQDYAGVAIDEWALCKREIWEEILRPVITQNDKRWAIFAFTPKGLNHAYEYWIKAENWPGWYRSLLKASDSGIITKEALDKAKNEMPAVLYDQEFECNFLAGDEYTLIKPYEIEALKGIIHNVVVHRKVISCDPSQGGDECVIYVFDGSKKVDELILHVQDTMKIVGELMILGNKHKCNDYAVDTIGIGAGIGDRLQELGMNVNRINSAEEADNKERFYNRRAEMWWYLMEQVQKQDLAYIVDDELKRQLTSVRYKVVNSNGKIQLEPKEKTKERLGRSPDRADAFVYGIWGLNNLTMGSEFTYSASIEGFEHQMAGGRGGY